MLKYFLSNLFYKQTPQDFYMIWNAVEAREVILRVNGLRIIIKKQERLGLIRLPQGSITIYVS